MPGETWTHIFYHCVERRKAFLLRYRRKHTEFIGMLKETTANESKASHYPQDQGERQRAFLLSNIHTQSPPCKPAQDTWEMTILYFIIMLFIIASSWKLGYIIDNLMKVWEWERKRKGSWLFWASGLQKEIQHMKFSN